MPDDTFAAAISNAANSAAAIVPTTTLMRRTLGELLADAVRLEAEADRLRALKRVQRIGPSDAK